MATSQPLSKTTKFLQYAQLVLWAVAIIMAVVIPLFTDWAEQLNEAHVPAVATYIFHMISVVLLLAAGYCVLAQRRHRVLRLVVVNVAILCTEALFFMMRPDADTELYIFLIVLLLSIIAYPLREPKKKEPLPEEKPAEVSAENAPVEKPAEVAPAEAAPAEAVPAEEPAAPVVEIPAEVED